MKKKDTKNSSNEIPPLKGEFYACALFKTMTPQTGKLLILLGLGLVALGVLVYFLHDKLHWLGRLPGDIRVERENFRLYVPLGTCLLLTLVVNLILWLVRRFF